MLTQIPIPRAVGISLLAWLALSSIPLCAQRDEPLLGPRSSQPPTARPVAATGSNVGPSVVAYPTTGQTSLETRTSDGQPIPWQISDRTGPLPRISASPSPRVAMTSSQAQLEQATTNGAPLVNGNVESTLQELQTRLNEVQASKELEETAKAGLAKQYQQAITHLTTVQETVAKTAQWKAEMAAAPTSVVEAKAALAAPTPFKEPVDDPNMPLTELEQFSAQAETKLREARAELANYEAQLNTRERKSELDKLIAERQKQLKDVESQLALPPAEGELPATAAARRAELRARQILWQSQLTAYQTEVTRNETLSELWTLRRDLGLRRVKELESYVRAWQTIVSERRKAEVERQAREALRQLEGAHPALNELVQTTFNLAAERVTLADRLNMTGRQMETSRKLLLEVQQNRGIAAAKDAAASRTSTIGLTFRKMRDELPDEDVIEDILDFIAREIPRVELRLIDLDEQRTEVGDQDESTRQALAGLKATTSETEILRIEPLVRKALERQRDSLDILIRDYDQYVDELTDLDETMSQLSDEVVAFTAFIDERILWVRSAERLGQRDWKESKSALAELTQPESWREAAALAIARVWNHPFWSAVILAGWCCLFLLRRRLRHSLTRLGKPEDGSTLLTARATTAAILLTAIIASLWPLLIWFIGRQLGQSIDDIAAQPLANGLQFELATIPIEPAWSAPKTGGGLLIDALAAALVLTAVAYWAIDLVRQVFRRDGVAERHLAWDPDSARLVRSTARNVMLVGLPVLLFLALIDSYRDGEYQDSLGRIAFIAAMILLTLLLNRLLRPNRGTLDTLWVGNPESWMHRFRGPIWMAAIVCPIALAILSAVGFDYSSHQLAIRLIWTLWLLLFVLFCRSLVARWLFIKQWNLARLFAEKRAAEEASKQTETAIEEAGSPQSLNSIAESARAVLRQEEQSTLATIDTQLRQLMRLGVAFALMLGIWFIWHDTFPALRALDRVSIWPAGQTTQATVEPVAETEPAPGATPTLAPGSEAPSTEPAPQMEIPMQGTSVADLLLALVVAVVTFLAGRNVPGLLEVLLLERLPLNSGARNAVTTICGYAIMLGGVLIGCNVIGLRWQSVQWLAAALTVGLGFGLQEIFANFVSGLILLFERPIRVGDVITLDDVTGTVTKIKIRATTITNWDRKELVVPNKDLVTGRLLNWTLADPTNRLVINVGVAYGSDTQRVHDLILQIANEHPDVLQDPEASVTFEDFGDSTLNFTLRCFLSGLGTRLPVRHAINSAIHQRFAAEGIEIAFPQRDIHIRSHIALPPADAVPVL